MNIHEQYTLKSINKQLLHHLVQLLLVSLSTGVQCICGIFLHLSTSTVLQEALIPQISSSFVYGLISLLTYSLSLCQRFSMGLQSGDLGGTVSYKLFGHS